MEYDYVIRFLKGLNEKFANAKSQIMMLDSFPSINKAFSLVIQQERWLHSLAVLLDDSKALISRAVKPFVPDPRPIPCHKDSDPLTK